MDSLMLWLEQVQSQDLDLSVRGILDRTFFQLSTTGNTWQYINISWAGVYVAPSDLEEFWNSVI
jgi:hypothetical protein